MNKAIDTNLYQLQAYVALLILNKAEGLAHEGLAFTEAEQYKLCDLVRANNRAELLKTLRPDFKDRINSVVLRTAFNNPRKEVLPLAEKITLELVRLRDEISQDLSKSTGEA